MQDNHPIIHICEWSSVDDLHLSSDQKRNINETVKIWQYTNNLSEPPIWFSGPDGETLNTRQYVGILEIFGITIEIYPKLDEKILEKDKIEDDRICSVMRNLLWILNVSGHLGIFEIDKAGLTESPVSYYDVFALLMAKNLRSELNLGISYKYIATSDDIRTVRGAIRLTDQITRNLNRLDLVSCEWDEFTPDIPMNQLLKCCCKYLLSRVRDAGAFKPLMDSIILLDQVSDVDPSSALKGAVGLRWDRTTERFHILFDLCKRLLQGIGHVLNSADSSTFVFLLDMNKVFEDYVRAVLEAYFNVQIQCQESIGCLFPEVTKGRIKQKPDYLWYLKDGAYWVGDAKYKHLAKNQDNPLCFAQLPEDPEDDVTSLLPAGNLLNVADVRQLTVYAELIRRDDTIMNIPEILLLYPFVGKSTLKSDATKAWNGSRFTICPVSMHRQEKLENALPANIVFGR